jgi:hypothetical protein
MENDVKNLIGRGAIPKKKLLSAHLKGETFHPFTVYFDFKHPFPGHKKICGPKFLIDMKYFAAWWKA